MAGWEYAASRPGAEHVGVEDGRAVFEVGSVDRVHPAAGAVTRRARPLRGPASGAR
ncbi:hypothetical protein [Motilibacter aurantiacus]|uniref:hypothetical protein n=1 Tax=Motilibacter aurantiacus TaxID=2714955 RepID=UPI001409DD91|nr:hypothetical protein [Motilibacter aurantiacus]NHC46065.1 hypothetical protein [Motilibacter aurantiacus]